MSDVNLDIDTFLTQDEKILRGITLLRREIAALRGDIKELMGEVKEIEIGLKETRVETRAEIRSMLERLKNRLDNLGFYMTRSDYAKSHMGAIKDLNELDPFILN